MERPPRTPELYDRFREPDIPRTWESITRPDSRGRRIAEAGARERDMDRSTCVRGGPMRKSRAASSAWINQEEVPKQYVGLYTCVIRLYGLTDIGCPPHGMHLGKILQRSTPAR